MGLRAWLTEKALQGAPDHRGLIAAGLAAGDELEGYVFGELASRDDNGLEDPQAGRLPAALPNLALAISHEALTLWDFGQSAREVPPTLAFSVDRFRVRSFARARSEVGGRAVVTITFADGSAAKYHVLQNTVYRDFFSAIEAFGA